MIFTSKMSPIWHTIVFVTLLAEIHAVGIDYYNGGREDADTKPNEDKNEYELLDFSRDDIPIVNESIHVESTDNMTNIRRRQSLNNEDSDHEEYIDYSTDPSHSLRINTTDTFGYEEYRFFDDNSTDKNMAPTPYPSSGNIANVNITTRQYLAGKFYNIKPNIIHMPRYHDSQDQFVSKWYIPENLCCWSEMPLLYAMPSPLTRGKKVFRIHGDSLENVTLSKTVPKPVRTPLPRVANFQDRWCTIAPCYGDHSLCLYADDKYGNLCDDGYQVVIPTVYERMAITNTLNAMRNRVANGQAVRYKHLGKAANMQRIMYDSDLESMATAWLRQCTPGPAHCVALEGSSVSQLMCTKEAKRCCHNVRNNFINCIPSRACFVPVILGCIHAWYERAGKDLEMRDVHCGHLEKKTYATAQILWAKTYKVGCAYGSDASGDVKVICNFSPGAPFVIERVFYCGIIKEPDLDFYRSIPLENYNFLSYIGIDLEEWTESDTSVRKAKRSYDESASKNYTGHHPFHLLYGTYRENKLRSKVYVEPNSTAMGVARVVSQYEFREYSQSKCDTEESIYVEGEPGSLCYETGRRFTALCYRYRDESGAYRTIAVLAPVALFSLILYDLFSSVVRQSTY